jgi:hypothetical protein
MANKVVDRNEIFLNGIYYPVIGQVQNVLTSQFPAKVVIGDTTRDSQTRASVVAWSDFRGGIGIERMKGATDVDRAWWSTLQLRFQGNLVLPGLATLTGDQGVSGVYDIGAIGELSDEIYAAFSTTVKKYNNITDSWGSSLHTLPSAATDVITGRVGGVVHMVFACDTHYVHTTDGSTFNDEVDNIKYMTTWDERLWGIDNTGQIRWTNDLSVATPVWIDDAQLPLPDGYVTDLFVARDAGGEHIIYASTKVGLYAHDAMNNRFVETEMTLPFHNQAGQGSVRWRDASFIPAGLGIYRYVAGSTAVIDVMGPDRDHGIPEDKRGYVRQLIPSHNDLLAVTDGTSAPRLNMFSGLGTGNQESEVIAQGIGTSAILGWNGMGWETKWMGTAAAKAVTYAHVANAYSTYRLWWAWNQRIYFMQLPSDIVNPKQQSNFDYATSGDLETPWFNADQEDINKLAIGVRIDVEDSSSSETVVASYGRNYSASYTTLGTITSDGTTEYLFPDSTTPTGTTFRAIRFKVALARGASSLKVSPNVLSITFIYRKKLPSRWGHQVEIDLSSTHKNNSPQELRSNLLASVESESLVELTFRDDTGGTRNFYVDIVSATGLEHTGYDERGTSRLTMVEI